MKKELLSEHAQAYLDDRVRDGKFSHLTMRSNRLVFLMAEKFLGGCPVHTMTARQIMGFINRPTERSVKAGAPVGLSASSRYSQLQILKHFFVWLADREDVADEVLELVLKEGRENPAPWKPALMLAYSVEDVKKIIRAAQEDSGPPCVAARNTLMIQFALFMMLRYGSITSIMLDSIDWDTKTCRARVKLKDVQLVEIPDFLIGPLREYVSKYRHKIFKKCRDQGYLFPSGRGGRFSYCSCHMAMSKIVATAGVKRDFDRGLHGVRRTGITHAIEVYGIPPTVVKDIAMHSHIQTTLHYNRPNPADRPTAKGLSAADQRVAIHGNKRARYERNTLARLKLKEEAS
jgi:integrase